MKHIYTLTFVALFCLPAPVARADAWNDYAKLMSHYYMIDKAETGSISCSVTSSLLDALLARMPGASDLLAEQLRSFKVSVRPSGEISFVTPRTRIDLDPPEASAMVSKGMTLIVGGLKVILYNILQAMVTDKPDKLTKLAVTPKGASTAISFSAKEYDGTPVDVDAVISGDTATAKVTTPKGVMEEVNKYVLLDGKYAPSSATVHRGGAKPFDGKVEIKYQKVGQVWFPSLISLDDPEEKIPDVRHIDIRLSDCVGP